MTAEKNTVLGVFLAGMLTVVGAAYYTGTTGNWVPLMAASIALGLLVLFVEST